METVIKNVAAKIELIHIDNPDSSFRYNPHIIWATEKDLFDFVIQLRDKMERSGYEVVVTL